MSCMRVIRSFCSLSKTVRDTWKTFRNFLVRYSGDIPRYHPIQGDTIGSNVLLYFSFPSHLTSFWLCCTSPCFDEMLVATPFVCAITDAEISIPYIVIPLSILFLLFRSQNCFFLSSSSLLLSLFLFCPVSSLVPLLWWRRSTTVVFRVFVPFPVVPKSPSLPILQLR